MLALTFALLAAVAAVSNAGLLTLTADQKQVILDTHNKLRAQTAQGLTPGQPSAANMVALEWDDRLMDKANNWVQNCKTSHDETVQRLIPGYSWVGQNAAGGTVNDIVGFVKMWFNEYSDYTYTGQACDGTCGHYTQVVWAKSTLVGCGLADCSTATGSSFNFICNYAFGGNFNSEQPYVSGPAGSQCNADYAFKQRGLCLRKDQCSGSDCVCTLSPCVNGGTMDSGNCRCNCPTGYYGDTCQNKCEDEASTKDLCDYYGMDICTYTNYAPKCAKTCNLCHPKVLRDPLVVNRDNVKARSP